MTEIQRATQILGGQKVLGTEIRSATDAMAMIKSGIPTRALAELIDHLKLSQNELACITGITKRTIARRISGDRLKPDESNRVYRLAVMVALAEEVFGDEEKARVWLSRPHHALGGLVPIRMLDTDIGTEELKKVLGRIAHGVYS
jgi:putative toxin-antitoxin system antitoxin component (TIGR02293 family)